MRKNDLTEKRVKEGLKTLSEVFNVQMPKVEFGGKNSILRITVLKILEHIVGTARFWPGAIGAGCLLVLFVCVRIPGPAPATGSHPRASPPSPVARNVVLPVDQHVLEEKRIERIAVSVEGLATGSGEVSPPLVSTTSESSSRTADSRERRGGGDVRGYPAEGRDVIIGVESVAKDQMLSYASWVGVTGQLYAVGGRDRAGAGGVSVENSRFSGTATDTTTVHHSVELARGNNATARIGGIVIK